MLQAIVFLLVALLLIGIWGTFLYFFPMLRWVILPVFVILALFLYLLYARRNRPTQDEVDPHHRQRPGMF